MTAHGVAGNIGNLADIVRSAFRGQARHDHAGKAVSGQSRLGQHVVHDLASRILVIAAGQRDRRGNHFPGPDQDRLDGNGAHIQTGVILIIHIVHVKKVTLSILRS